MFTKKKYLCAAPNKPLGDFEAVLHKVGKIPSTGSGLQLNLNVKYKNDQQAHELLGKTTVMQNGTTTGPVVILLPWFGGKSQNLKQYLNIKAHRNWAVVGVDAFHSPKNINQILYTAEGSRHAYALVITLLTRLIKLARQQGRSVAAVGLSYGANIISAYLSRGLEGPDAIVAIEGGNIIETTLHGYWKGMQYDPKVLDALNKNPNIIPTQQPTAGKAAKISLAIINSGDRVVLEQEQTWQNAKTKVYIKGSHTAAPLLNIIKIRRLVDEHLAELLA